VPIESQELEARFWKDVLGLPAPDREALYVHAEKFGPEGVNETAQVYGVNMKVKKAAPKPKRRRRTTAELRHQVLELHRRKIVPAAIADTLNVSDRRVAQILRSEQAA
jgi:hypothetical protein